MARLISSWYTNFGTKGRGTGGCARRPHESFSGHALLLKAISVPNKSATASETPSEERKPRQQQRRAPRNAATSGRRTADVSSLKEWLASLDLPVKPAIHINGHAFTSAVLTVDFGSPLKPVKLSFEQNQELMERMRKLTRDVLGREGNVRISHDAPNGIYWASV